MAASQSKRSVHRAQPHRRPNNKRSRKPTPGSLALVETKLSGRRFIHFPEVSGKITENIHLYTATDYHCITIDFRDRTSLSLEIEPTFLVKAELQQIKKGDAHIVAEWPAIHSQR